MDTITCPLCGSDNLRGDVGDQKPSQIEIVHPDGEIEQVDSYDWVILTCRDCRHQWESGPGELSPAQQMERAGAQLLFS